MSIDLHPVFISFLQISIANNYFSAEIRSGTDQDKYDNNLIRYLRPVLKLITI